MKWRTRSMLQSKLRWVVPIPMRPLLLLVVLDRWAHQMVQRPSLLELAVFLVAVWASSELPAWEYDVPWWIARRIELWSR